MLGAFRLRRLIIMFFRMLESAKVAQIWPENLLLQVATSHCSKSEEARPFVNTCQQVLLCY